MSCACKGSDDGRDGRVNASWSIGATGRARRIARVARCPAQPTMRPFALLTVIAVPLTPRTREELIPAHLPGQIVGPDPSQPWLIISIGLRDWAHRFPIWVVKNGMRVRRTSSPDPELSAAGSPAAPSMMSGRFAARIISAARSSAAGGARGCRPGAAE